MGVLYTNDWGFEYCYVYDTYADFFQLELFAVMSMLLQGFGGVAGVL